MNDLIVVGICIVSFALTIGMMLYLISRLRLHIGRNVKE
jgi:hypothetical protein